jgi:hypothetical protein
VKDPYLDVEIERAGLAKSQRVPQLNLESQMEIFVLTESDPAA